MDTFLVNDGFVDDSFVADGFVANVMCGSMAVFAVRIRTIPSSSYATATSLPSRSLTTPSL